MEEYKMTVKEANEYLKNSIKEGLYAFTLFFYSPVSKTLEVREGYFTQYFEGKMWLESIQEGYVKLQVPYASYIDGKLEDSKGDIVNGIWR